MLTKPAFHHTVGTYLKLTTRKRLSRAALETLAIVAYKQPVPKSELEKIRGVNCDYALQKLLEKELVSIVGRSEGPGRPLLYGTSQKFMDYFGLKGLEDLPRPKDFKEPDQEIGEKAPIEETGEVPPQEQKKEEESDD
jgi:segregation and condensation protein B